MQQRKKNIRLIQVFAVLMVAIVVLALTMPSKSRISIDREKFTYDPATIDRVELKHADGRADRLYFSSGQWMVNDRKADPQRVSVLFAILSQARVRRKAPAIEQESLAAAYQEKGVSVAFYEGEDLVQSFDVLGDETRGLTYYKEADGTDMYLVEIPGYKNYLAGIYELDENGWRYPRIFDFNWGNLKRVDVSYIKRPEEGFGVSFIDGFFRVENIAKTDTSKITDFLDNLSLMYVNDYLTPSESAAYDSLKADLRSQVIVRDVGDNPFQLDILGTLPGQKEILVWIDSSEYALASLELMNMAMKPRGFFVEKSGSE